MSVFDYGLDDWAFERQLIGQGAVRCGGAGTTPARKKRPRGSRKTIAVPPSPDAEAIVIDLFKPPIVIPATVHTNEPPKARISVNLRQIVGHGICDFRREGNPGPYVLTISHELGNQEHIVDGDIFAGVVIRVGQSEVHARLDAMEVH